MKNQAIRSSLPLANLDKRDIKDYLNMPERVMRNGVWVNIRAANQAQRINKKG